MTDREPLLREFYTRDGLTVARELIGKTLVHRVDGVELCGVIIETEAYMGVTDKASHAYGGRRTNRTETMYLCGGYAYVYRIYGIYVCMNITASVEGSAEAVLIRGVLPTDGCREMFERYRKYGRRSGMNADFSDVTPADLYKCTNGPGKLCISMGIGMEENRADMLSENFYVRDDGYRFDEVLCSPRIGIDYAGEAALYPWRFHVKERKGVPLIIR